MKKNILNYKNLMLVILSTICFVSNSVAQVNSVNISTSTEFCGTETKNFSLTLGGTAIGNLTYTWSTSGDGTFSAPNGSSTNYTPGVGDLSNGSFSLTVAVDDDGDASHTVSSPATMSVFDLPQINAISNDGAQCEGVAIHLNATTSAGDGIITSYTWTGANSFSASSEDATISNPSNANDGVYTLTITDANGCSVNSSTTVTVYKKPSIAAISNDGPKCEGLNIALNATTADGDAAITTYAWTGSNSFTANTEDAT
ncbi:MAG: hypothetical protein ACOVP1_09050, partial [Bacteroidia bacterium]